MNVLDTIDTTVTFEWGQTRTIGTLIALSGRRATVTTLRAPDLQTPVFLRVEGTSEDDAMAIDGTCIGVSDSDWGEQQVEVDIHRVGTTASAVILRDFIEKHGVERGGSVSVGRNRDNPDLKRFVYSLPELGAATPTPRVAAPVHLVGRDTDRTTILPAVQPQPDGDAADAMPDLEAILAQAAAFADSMPSDDAPGTRGNRQTWTDPGPSAEPEPAAPQPTPVPSKPEPPKPVPPKPAPNTDLDRDLTESIVVHTVAPDEQVAAPVVTIQGGKSGGKSESTTSLMRRLLGRKDSTEPNRPPAAQATAANAASSEASGRSAPGFSAEGARAQVAASAGSAASALFAVDLAVRADRPIQFEAAKKKRPGVLLRLGETKMRIRAGYSPQLYDRITVFLPPIRGKKDAVPVQCEVTRVRTPEADGHEAAFDVRLTANNTALVMAAIRAFMAETESNQ